MGESLAITSNSLSDLGVACQTRPDGLVEPFGVSGPVSNAGTGLKGLFWAPARLADGTRKIYWYAWRGGPRLKGEPGSPEFVASYNKAVARLKTDEGSDRLPGVTNRTSTSANDAAVTRPEDMTKHNGRQE
jgi:hypothetical protein